MSAAHILVVDDEPDIRQLIQEILEDEGYEVSVAENAESARNSRRARRPEWILSRRCGTRRHEHGARGSHGG